MVLRWVAAGVLEAVRAFRRHKGMPTRVTAALRARDQQLGLVKSDALNVASQSSPEPPLHFSRRRSIPLLPRGEGSQPGLLEPVRMNESR
jgi:hypothetical protein